MDRMRVSEALDTGSIPVGRASSLLFSLLPFKKKYDKYRRTVGRRCYIILDRTPPWYC